MTPHDKQAHAARMLAHLETTMPDGIRFYSPNDPWEVAVCDDGGLVVCTKGDVICQSDPNHEDKTADHVWFALIAAAPDLLAVLREISEVDAKYCSSLSVDTIGRMNAALAKAEGRT